MQLRSSKVKCPYAITGAALLLVSLGCMAVSYTTPFGKVVLDENGRTVEMQFGIMGFAVADGDQQEIVKYRNQQLDDGPGIKALRLGFWLVPIGGFLVLASVVTLLAAPSSGFGAARGGAVIGLIASTILLVSAVALLVGYTDQAEFIASNLEDSNGIRFAGNDLAAGAVWLGAAIVVGFGGSVLGFSDKGSTAS